jgi:hypothetical protein
VAHLHFFQTHKAQQKNKKNCKYNAPKTQQIETKTNKARKERSLKKRICSTTNIKKPFVVSPKIIHLKLEKSKT